MKYSRFSSSNIKNILFVKNCVSWTVEVLGVSSLGIWDRERQSVGNERAMGFWESRGWNIHEVMVGYERNLQASAWACKLITTGVTQLLSSLHFLDKALNSFSQSRSVAKLLTLTPPQLPSDYKRKPLFHSILVLDSRVKENRCSGFAVSGSNQLSRIEVLAGYFFLSVIIDKKLELWSIKLLRYAPVSPKESGDSHSCISRNQDSPVCLRKPKRWTQPRGSPST